VFVFYVHPAVARLHKPLIVLDAAGLGLFAVAGAKKALDAGLNAPASVGIGMLTAIGGGVLRDLLVSEIPTVLHREIYTRHELNSNRCSGGHRYFCYSSDFEMARLVGSAPR
jgi:uncharacterized membrane protein YeiH